MDDETVLTQTETSGGGAEETLDLGGLESVETTDQAEHVEAPAAEHEEQQTEERRDAEHRDSEEKELAEYKGMVSGRIRGLVKQAPELAAVLKKYPAAQAVIEGVFRREAAMREIFPTVAEARALREALPGGVQDLEAMQEAETTLATIDEQFYKSDANGNYPGHEEMIRGFVSDDKPAALSMFKSIVRSWPQHDRESYNDVMGKIVGATLVGMETVESLSEVLEAIDSAPDQAKALLGKQINRLSSFTKERQKTPQDEQLERERADRRRENDERARTDQKTFDRTFSSSNLQLQKGELAKHPVVAKLQALKSLSAEKKADIVEKIRKQVQDFLVKSPSFMRKLRAAYQSRDMATAEKIQRAAWSQPWLLNRVIRSVLQRETPQLVSSNREAARRAAAPQAKVPAKNGSDGKPRPRTSPYKLNGQWYKPDGRRMSVEEAMKASIAGELVE